MFRALACLLALTAALLMGGQAQADTITGRVVAVADGDTFTLSTASGSVVVRINGIDAPERGQAHGPEAKAALGALALGQAATLETSKRDRYGRQVGLVTVDGHDVGLELVKSGHAWAFRRYLKELPPDTRRDYLQAENQAREARRGLWSDPHPKAPWDWRSGTATMP